MHFVYYATIFFIGYQCHLLDTIFNMYTHITSPNLQNSSTFFHKKIYLQLQISTALTDAASRYSHIRKTQP